ncbi:hypothetical protein WJX72_004659 [[Myrmecia] bisecta]|uniref:Mediator complex subunit 10 n=1 Tax=[Myrmecia] bisecta TaxID=41462 RepID=A0AAW1PDI0_9CHLO
MSAPRKATFKDSIQRVLWKIHELEATISDFSGDQELLFQRLNEYTAELAHLQEQSEHVKDYNIPVEILKYVDEGGNPDEFTRDVFKRALHSNQLVKGKTECIRDFRDAILSEARSAYPQEAAFLRQELESDEPLKQATALLQLLNYLAGGRDVGSLVTAACQSAVSTPAPPPVKKLGYDVVRAAALTDTDWDLVCQGLKLDVGGHYATEVQCAALELLPCVPPHKLATLLTEGELSGKLTPCFLNSFKEVRSAATDAVSQCLHKSAVLAVLAGSASLVSAALEWVDCIANGLLDPAHSVAAAAHAAVYQLLTPEAGAWEASSPADSLRERLAGVLCGQAVTALSAVLRRARSLPPEDQLHVAPSLVSVMQFAASRAFSFPQPSSELGSGAPEQSWDAAFGGAEPAGGLPKTMGGWMVEQVGEYLASLLTSINPSVVLEAAKGILALNTLISDSFKGRDLVSSAAAAGSWVPLAVAALIELWDRQLSGAAHTQLMAVLAPSISALQVTGQIPLIRQLVPMIATLPLAADRVKALAHLWKAAVDLDLATRHAVQTNDRVVAGAELKTVLSDSFIMEVISGVSTGGRDSVAPGAKYPAFREEMVCTLLETLRAHPRAATPNSQLQAPPPVGPDEDMAVVAEMAALTQRIAELSDWLGAAKIALQGTKACLGWDPAPTNGCHACTVVVDTWLTLLQHALHAGRALPHSAADPGRRYSSSDGSGLAPEMEGKVGALVSSHLVALQELISQLLLHWKVLSAAVKPRALWVAAHHLELAARLDNKWTFLLQAVGALLGGNEEDVKTRRMKAARSAGAEGRLSASKSNNPFAKGHATDEASASLTTIDEAEIISEGIEAALLSMERFAALLVFNSGDSITPSLQEIATNAATIIQPYTKGRGSVLQERCSRIFRQIAPIATAKLPAPPASPAPAPGTEGSQPGTEEAPPTPSEPVKQLLPGPFWTVHEGYPHGGPASGVLQSTKRFTRYWRLRDLVRAHVAEAANPKDSGRGGRSVRSAAEKQADDVDTVMNLVEVMEVVMEVVSGGEAKAGAELSGPTDPLRITVWHQLDAAACSLTLKFEAHNRMTSELKGAAIRLALGGPMIPASRQPPQYKLAVVPSGEGVRWQMSLSVTDFGRLTVQPFVHLPAKAAMLPGDDPSLRCSAYHISPVAMLQPPAERVTSEAFFLHWASMHAGTNLTGVCTAGGVDGGLAMLSALERTPLQRTMLTGIASQGGFQAAYLGYTWNQVPLGIVITGQLLPVGPPALPSAANPNPSPGRVVCRVSIRSPSRQVVATIEADRVAFVRDLWGGTLAEGLAADGMRGSRAVKVHPAVAPLRELYAVSKIPPAPENAADANGSPAPARAIDVLNDGGFSSHDVEAAVLKEWQRLRALQPAVC